MGLILTTSSVGTSVRLFCTETYAKHRNRTDCLILRLQEGWRLMSMDSRTQLLIHISC